MTGTAEQNSWFSLCDVWRGLLLDEESSETLILFSCHQWRWKEDCIVGCTFHHANLTTGFSEPTIFSKKMCRGTHSFASTNAHEVLTNETLQASKVIGTEFIMGVIYTTGCQQDITNRSYLIFVMQDCKQDVRGNFEPLNDFSLCIVLYNINNHVTATRKCCGVGGPNFLLQTVRAKINAGWCKMFLWTFWMMLVIFFTFSLVNLWILLSCVSIDQLNVSNFILKKTLKRLSYLETTWYHRGLRQITLFQH